MARDRFIRWNTDRRPTHEELRHMLEDYLDQAAKMIGATDGVFVVTLIGRSSHPFKRLPGGVFDAVVRGHEEAFGEVNFERWFEVFLSADMLTVTTRMADDFTNAVADRFAQLCARFWDGEVEQG